MPPKSTLKSSRTCDNCRKRKIRCVESEIDPEKAPCLGCRNIGIKCTHEYVKKKPGRKNSFAMAAKASQSNGNNTPNGHSSMFSTNHRLNLLSPTTSHQTYHHPWNFNQEPLRTPVQGNPLQPSPSSERTQSYNRQPTPLQHSPYSHPTSSSSGASSSTMHQPDSSRYPSSFTSTRPTGAESTGLSWLDSLLDPSSSTSLGLGNGMTNFNGYGDFLVDSITGIGQFPSEQAHLLSLESPPNMLANPNGITGFPNGSNGVGSMALSDMINPTVNVSGFGHNGRRESLVVMNGTSMGIRVEPQLEDVASWTNISHYISLFLQYLYPLLPLVHRPTFAENLATRLDLRDTDFRALLLSIVAYTISQLPTSRLLNDQYDIEGLKRLQRRCHKTSQLLQRSYHGTTNLTQICIIIFDNFYLVSIGLSHTAAARLGVAVQLAFSLGMHSDAKTAALGLDAVEVQLRRRVFWQLYCSDKTRAIPGHPMLINDFQGVCSYPEPIDDDLITTVGLFPQPTNRPSLLSGFISVCRLFKILSECFFHHRCILSDHRTISLDWTVQAEDRVHEVLRDMPGVIQDPNINRTEALRQVFAMQRANILITAAIAKFALYDLRAALHVDEEQLARERETIAREIHSLLMNIPVEDLASNGESVRAKVFHIACALCAQVPANETDHDLIKDWFNMFSAITFVQMPPPPPDVAADSRANSPPPPTSDIPMSTGK